MDRNNSNDRTTAGVIAATAIIATIALLALAGLGGVSCAAEGENAGGSEGEIAGAAVSAASVTDRINYQGRLTDSSGSPLTGTHTMTFGLYDVSTGGTALATDIHDVVVTDGLFNTGIDFGTSYFDGRELWLGVAVGTDDEMTPRQELRPVPYALGLKPGAHVKGHILCGSVFSVTNTGDSSGGYDCSGSYGIESVTNGPIGVRGASAHVDGAGIAGYGWGDNGQGVFGQGTDWGVRGYSVYGEGVKGTNGITGNYGALGLSNSGVYGKATGSSWAGYFSGNIYVAGNSQFDVGGGSIAITTPGGWPGMIAYSPNGHRRDVQFYNDCMCITTSNSSSAPSSTNGIQIYENGNVACKVLQITGGSDLSEQYEISGIRTELLPSPGMVVSIDPENLGDLVVSNNTYDRRVAGIISGAGGIKPGMLMGQSGSVADGEYPVALTGRVYCWADASNSPIEPGDLLTTSDTPGHAMKVTDYTRAQGAVIGKAMSSLDEGQGLVLVLVTLQ